jgi:hypothetical protein
MIFRFAPALLHISLQDFKNTHPETMKITRTIFIALSIMMISQSASGAGYDMAEINQKIKAITDKRLHLIETAIDEGNLLQSQEMMNLQGRCTTDWMQIVANFEKIDGGDNAKKMAIIGLGQLSPQDYMTAIEALITKYEAGSLGETLIDSVLFPMGRMGSFLTDNFNHPRVVAAINRVRTKSDNQALDNRLSDILNGTDKRMRDDFREAHAGLPEGNTPVVILPP